MQKFTDIKVWQRAHSLVLDVYRLTKTFPKEEQYGITSQLRRAAVSVSTNIAEGAKRDSNVEYARFLNIAQASLAETEYLLMLSRDLAYADPTVVAKLLADSAEVGGMLNALRVRVCETHNPQPTTHNSDG